MRRRMLAAFPFRVIPEGFKATGGQHRLALAELVSISARFGHYWRESEMQRAPIEQATGTPCAAEKIAGVGRCFHATGERLPGLGVKRP